MRRVCCSRDRRGPARPPSPPSSRCGPTASVRFVNARTGRPGGEGQLAEYSATLGFPLIEAGSPEDLAAAARHKDPLVADTAGIDPADARPGKRCGPGSRRPMRCPCWCCPPMRRWRMPSSPPELFAPSAAGTGGHPLRHGAPRRRRARRGHGRRGAGRGQRHPAFRLWAASADGGRAGAPTAVGRARRCALAGASGLDPRPDATCRRCSSPASRRPATSRRRGSPSTCRCCSR